MTRLVRGDDLPSFEARLWRGGVLRSADLLDERVWLAFFRYAACPLCNLRVADIARRWEDLAAAELRVIGVFQSDTRSLDEHMSARQPPFEIVADPEQRLYEAFGVGVNTLAFVNPLNLVPLARATARGLLPGRPDGPIGRLPADFLVSPGGRIDDAFYATRIGDHIPFERVEAFARATAI